jgi:hypothetical protein
MQYYLKFMLSLYRNSEIKLANFAKPKSPTKQAMMKTRLLPRSQRLLWLSVLGSMTFQGYATELAELRLAHKSNITFNMLGTLPVSGIITSAKDGSPIIGASVFVKGNPKLVLQLMPQENSN